MSKKNKQVKSTPDMYHGVPTTPTRPNILIMEDMDGNISLHNNKEALEKLQSFNALIKDTIQKIWPNLNKFLEENKQTILAYHANLFGAEPPKDQPIEQTGVMVWNKFILTAKSDLTTEIPVIAGRKSTIGLSEYSRGEETGDGQLKTPQAKTCLKLFREAIGEQQTIKEADLRQYVVDHAGELHTKQDPWRIFQYYRPQLITEKLIKRK